MYVINPENLTAYECEIIDINEDEYGKIYHVEIWDSEMNNTVDFEANEVYETIADAQRAIDEEIKKRIESQCSCSYQAGYDFACGYYD